MLGIIIHSLYSYDVRQSMVYHGFSIEIKIILMMNEQAGIKMAPHQRKNTAGLLKNTHKNVDVCIDWVSLSLPVEEATGP